MTVTSTYLYIFTNGIVLFSCIMVFKITILMTIWEQQKYPQTRILFACFESNWSVMERTWTVHTCCNYHPLKTTEEQHQWWRLICLEDIVAVEKSCRHLPALGCDANPHTYYQTFTKSLLLVTTNRTIFTWPTDMDVLETIVIIRWRLFHIVRPIWPNHILEIGWHVSQTSDLGTLVMLIWCKMMSCKQLSKACFEILDNYPKNANGA